MSGSSSSPTNTTTTSTQAQETNVSASGTQGVTVLGNKGPVNLSSTNITTDEGAVTAAVGLGNAAIAKNTGLSQSVATCSFNFGNHALDVISEEQTQSASLVSNYLAQGASELNQAEAGYLAIAQNASETNNTQLANISETLANIAQANDTSQQSQSESLMKSALIIVAGIAVIYLLTRG